MSLDRDVRDFGHSRQGKRRLGYSGWTACGIAYGRLGETCQKTLLSVSRRKWRLQVAPERYNYKKRIDDVKIQKISFNKFKVSPFHILNFSLLLSCKINA